MKFLVLCGLAATIGCGGSHPEEGMLKLPARKAEVPDAAKPGSTKASPAVKKILPKAKEDPVGK